MSSSSPLALPYPFLRQEFLQALEHSHSACSDTGWQPRHINIATEQHTQTMPLYLKNHSMGEYVFDHSWANAYYEHDLDYYPKLITAIPFTPSTGPRIAALDQLTSEHGQQLFNQVLAVAEDTGASSWHLLFPNDQQRALFTDSRLLHRTGVQYHWHNRGYTCFDDYLNALNSRKRKMVRKERAEVAAQDITVDLLEGSQIDASIWQLFYRLYERTYAKRNGTRGYLTEAFFNQIAHSMPEQIAMAVARRDNQPIACALYFFDSDTLYGRYWGSAGEFSCLHFELCYYRGIEYAIDKGLQRYDAGAQGEHKLIRGFEPVETHSLHWIEHPQFRQAIKRFLDSEQRHIAQHIQQANEILPFKKSH